MKSYGVTIQMKGTEQYYPVALFNVVRCSGGFRERGREGGPYV